MFAGSTPRFRSSSIWDDHEVLNNWYPTEILGPRHAAHEHSVALLAARAKRAFLEYTPMRPDPSDPERIYRAVRFGPLVEIFGFDMRSYRGAEHEKPPDGAVRRLGNPRHGAGRVAEAAAARVDRDLEGHRQRHAAGTHRRRRAAVRGGGQRRRWRAARPRELEIAGLAAVSPRRRIRNVVFVTGDVHYCAAHHYDPARAAFTEFHPFWEFVAGPGARGNVRPAELDATFGPEVKFIGIPPG